MPTYESYEVLVYWQEGELTENGRLLIIETAQGPYETITWDDYTLKAKTVLDVWNSLGAPVGAGAVNVTASKAAVK